jgi:zinc transporter 1/2/3
MALSNLTIYKIAALVGIFIITFAFAVFPVCYKKFRTSNFWLGVANAFSGGLFLSAGLIHILPEAQASMEKFNKGKESFPWPFFAATASFSLVLFIDKVLFNNHDHNIDVADFHAEDSKEIKASMSRLHKNSEYP